MFKTISLKVISIYKKDIIIIINHPFQCKSIYLIEDKGIFLVGGNNKNVKVYRNDNYECIQTIKNVHEKNIYSFIELKNGSIISSSYKIMKSLEFFNI